MLNQSLFCILFDLFKGYYTNQTVCQLYTFEIIFSVVNGYFRIRTPVPAAAVLLKFQCVLSGTESKLLFSFRRDCTSVRIIVVSRLHFLCQHLPTLVPDYFPDHSMIG